MEINNNLKLFSFLKRNYCENIVKNTKIVYINWTKLYTLSNFMKKIIFDKFFNYIKTNHYINNKESKTVLRNDLKFLSENLICIVYHNISTYNQEYSKYIIYFAINSDKKQDFLSRNIDINNFIILNEENYNIKKIMDLPWSAKNVNIFNFEDHEHPILKLDYYNKNIDIIKDICINKKYKQKICLELTLEEEFFNKIIKKHQDDQLIFDNLYKIIESTYNSLKYQEKILSKEYNESFENQINGIIKYYSLLKSFKLCFFNTFYLNYYIEYDKDNEK